MFKCFGLIVLLCSTVNSFKQTKNSIRSADSHSFWSMTNKEINPITKETDLNFQQFNFNGITKPLNYFDPLGFAKSKQQRDLVKLREAELKHSRWGMISSAAIPVTELVTHEKAIHVLDNANANIVIAFLGFIAAAEFQSILLGWENPFVGSNYLKLKEKYEPGDLGFGVSRSFLDKDEIFMSNAELNNGRLAMIGSLGMIVQELVTDKPIF
jgi:hypothetical protein